MLALGPALSVAYKSLGGGESRYIQKDTIGHFGLSEPLGTRSNVGYGILQFVNATLPWFKDPGFTNRVYGFNMHVATETMSVMLDGLTAEYIDSLQASLAPMQSKIVTATVPAIVCNLNAQLDQSVKYFKNLWGQPNPNTSSPTSAEFWSRIIQTLLLPIGIRTSTRASALTYGNTRYPDKIIRDPGVLAKLRWKSSMPCHRINESLIIAF